MTTRLIGAIIMVHGDDSGLVLPPRIAPVQAMVIPIQQQKDGVLDTAKEVCERIGKVCRAKLDDSDKSPGWKFSEQEMRGIPVRIELGPKDIASGKFWAVRRDTREKIEIALDELEAKLPELLEQIQKDMFARAKAHRDAHIWDAHNYEEFTTIANEKPGFIRAMWCGDVYKRPGQRPHPLYEKRIPCDLTFRIKDACKAAGRRPDGGGTECILFRRF